MYDSIIKEESPLYKEGRLVGVPAFTLKKKKNKLSSLYAVEYE